MKDKYKLIIGILSAIIVILIIIIIILLTKINKLTDNNIDNHPNNNDKVKQMVGVYLNSNWNGKEALIILNEDMTCKIPSSTALCNWDIINNKLALYSSGYKIIYNRDKTDNTIQDYSLFPSINQCEEYVKNKYKNYTDKLNCEFKQDTNPVEYIITNSSIIYNNNVFTKVY